MDLVQRFLRIGLVQERIAVARLAPVAESDHRRPIGLLLTQQRHQLVVDRLVLHRVHEHVRAGTHYGLLVGHLDGVRVQKHPALVRLLDDRVVDLGCHLRGGAAPIVHSDLHLPDPLGAHALHGGARLGAGGHFVDHL